MTTRHLAPGRKRRPSDSFDRRLLAPLILGSLLNPVNSSMIAVALVPIGVAFGAPPSETAWLVAALYLATAVGQPVVGRLVDTYGPRRLYLIGAALVGVAGILGVLAPSLGFLIAARVLLGFGTCAGFPAAMFLIRSEADRTGQSSPSGVLTVLAVATQSVAVIGPTLGGLLIGAGGWRAIFAVNIPLAVTCLVLGARRLPARAAFAPSTTRPPRIDLPGIALFATMLVSLMVFLLRPGIGSALLLPVVAVAAAGFVLRERRVADPFLDVRVLGGNLPLLATYGRTLLAYVVSYAFLYGYTQWLEDARGLSPSQSGLILLPTFLTAIVVSAATGRRPQIRGKLVVGAATQVAGCLLLLLFDSGTGIAMLVVLSLVLGVPQGLNSLANQNAVYHQADPERIGSSSGLLRTFTYLGAMVATAASAAFFTDRADTHGLHQLALFMLAAAGLFLLLTLADRSLGRVGSDPARPHAERTRP